MEPVTIMAVAMVTRLLSPVVKEGWKKITNAEAKEEKKRIENNEREYKNKLELQRLSHEQRMLEASEAHKLSLDKWKTQTYYEKCWPLRNPFEMQICEPISDDKSYFDENIIVPCRLISALKEQRPSVCPNYQRKLVFLCRKLLSYKQCPCCSIGNWGMERRCTFE